MAHDNARLPTEKIRRRSVFEDHKNEGMKNGSEGLELRFPTTKTEMYYPVEYVEKVRTEMEQWKMHITKTLQENKKFKAEKTELENMIIGENILTSDERYTNISFDYEKYVRKAQNFCDRAAIITRLQCKSEREAHNRYLFTQRKLEEQIIKNENSTNYM